MNCKRIYNRVMDSNSRTCQLGELLTDEELEKVRRRTCIVEDWPNTAKVVVEMEKVYYRCNYEKRFAESYELAK